MKLSDAIPAVETAIRENYNLGFKGSPGIGKTDVLKACAKKLGFDLMISHPVISEPTDYKGLPALVNNVAEFLPYGDLRRMLDAKKELVVLFDDLGQVPATVQAAIMQITLERQIGEHKISPFVRFLIATNNRKDKAGVAGILTPLVNRFTLLDIEADVNDWVKWALQNAVPVELIAFLRFKPELINTFESKADVSFASPRSITMLGGWIKSNIINLDVWKGCVGEKFAIEMYAFYKVFKELAGLPDKIIMNPDSANIPSNPATMYALCGALTHRASDVNFGNICKYAKRIPKEFATALIVDATTKKPSFWKRLVTFNGRLIIKMRFDKKIKRL